MMPAGSGIVGSMIGYESWYRYVRYGGLAVQVERVPRRRERRRHVGRPGLDGHDAVVLGLVDLAEPGARCDDRRGPVGHLREDVRLADGADRRRLVLEVVAAAGALPL